MAVAARCRPYSGGLGHTKVVTTPAPDSGARPPTPQWAVNRQLVDLCLSGEEGIGDELGSPPALAFPRYAQDCRVTFECSARLETLYKRTPTRRGFGI